MKLPTGQHLLVVLMPTPSLARVHAKHACNRIARSVPWNSRPLGRGDGT